MAQLKGLIIPIFIITSWMLVAELNITNSYLIPSPLTILETTLSLIEKGVLLEHIAVSMYRVFTGFIITFIIAFPLAILIGLNRKLEAYFDTLIHFVRHIPPIACIPIIILWFGIGEASKVTIIVLAAFFPVFLNSLAGIIGADKKLIEVGQVFGFSNYEKFLKIILPAAFPSILLGIRLGIGYSWRALIGAELIAASAGIGYMIIDAEQLSRPDIVISGILTIGILGYLMDFVLLKLSQKLVPWNREVSSNDNFSAKGAL